MRLTTRLEMMAMRMSLQKVGQHQFRRCRVFSDAIFNVFVSLAAMSRWLLLLLLLAAR